MSVSEILLVVYTSATIVVAVFAWLVYKKQTSLLDTQIKQLAKSIQSSTYQNLAIQMASLDRLLIEDPLLEDAVFKKSFAEPRWLYESKAKRFCLLWLDVIDCALVQHDLGTIPKEGWLSWENYIIDSLAEVDTLACTYLKHKDIYTVIEKFVQANTRLTQKVLERRCPDART